MADRPMVIPFHVNNKKYFWNKASGVVTNERNEVVITGCFSLQTARARIN